VKVVPLKRRSQRNLATCALAAGAALALAAPAASAAPSAPAGSAGISSNTLRTTAAAIGTKVVRGRLGLAVVPRFPVGAKADGSPVGTVRLRNYGWGNYCIQQGGRNGSRTLFEACANSGAAFNSQAWTIYDESNGWYELVNVATGLCLDADNNHLTSGAAVQTWFCNGQQQQHWGMSIKLNYAQRIKNKAAYNYQNNDRFLLDTQSNLQRLWSDGGTSDVNQYWLMI
jgi:Ricin-type beta-trefoil lectin domain-like